MNDLAREADRSFLIVMNAGSGSQGDADKRAVIEQVLGESGRPFRFLLVDDPEHLSGVAAAAVAEACGNGGIVVAAGGDGTINAVAKAVLAGGCRLGALPGGTFNYFCRTHGIPDDLAEATRVLLTGEAAPVQVALANERLFIVNASLGLHPQALEDREAWTRQWGRSRVVAVLSGLATLLRGHRHLRIRVDCGGKVHDVRTPTLFVGNNRLQLERLGAPEAAAPDEGQLAAIMVRPVGTFALLWLTLRGAAGTLGQAPDVTGLRFDRMTVLASQRRRARRFKVAIDGELTRLQAPLVFTVAPDRLMLIKPRAAGPAP